MKGKDAGTVLPPITTSQKNRIKYTKILKEMQEDTYCYATLKRIIDKGSITSMQAFSEQGNTRLSATIYTLKNEYGIPIDSRIITKKSGRKVVNFSEYFIGKGA